MLDSNQVPIEQSALLVIDAQDSFKVGPLWTRRNNPAFEKNVGALIAAYRAAELPVIRRTPGVSENNSSRRARSRGQNPL